MVLSLRLCIILVITLSLSQFQFVGAHDYDHHHYDHHVSSAFLTTEDFIRNEGFEGKTYEVITEDGYILQITRILSSGTGHKKPFLMMPGIGENSDGYSIGENSLPYVMARANYDVWLGNVRGADFYGLKHVSLSSDSREFWDFSFHECGLYDLPAIIDFVLSVTGHSKLIYMGHSQGTTYSYVLLSLRPEYNDKIALAIHYGPTMVAYATKSPVLTLIKVIYSRGISEAIVNIFGINQLSSLSRAVQLSRFQFCNQVSLRRDLCWMILGSLAGFDDGLQRNITYSGTVFSHILGGICIKNLFHLLQNTQSSQFLLYDYGSIKNLQLYNSTKPPMYPLQNIKTRIWLTYAENDVFIPRETLDYVRNHLDCPHTVYNIPSPKFSHADYGFITDPNVLFYPTLDFIEEYFDKS